MAQLQISAAAIATANIWRLLHGAFLQVLQTDDGNDAEQK